jgi:hypothetical protein
MTYVHFMQYYKKGSEDSRVRGFKGKYLHWTPWPLAPVNPVF